MYETAISIVQEYIDEHLFDPNFNWQENFFAERSYSRWAAYTIRRMLVEESSNGSRFPIDVILEFICITDISLCKSDSRTSNLIFSTAKDTANSILCLFL